MDSPQIAHVVPIVLWAAAGDITTQRAEPSREIAPHCRDQEPDRHHRLGHRPRRSGDWGAPHTSFASDNCAISERHILRNCTDPTAPIVMADTPVTPAAISPSMRASAATTAKNATMGLRRMSVAMADPAAQFRIPPIAAVPRALRSGERY
jgi:hypothetical protein